MNCAKDRIVKAFSKRRHVIHIAFLYNKASARWIYLFFFYALITIHGVNAQDLRFTQYHASDTYLNPAFAGSAGDPGITINFRDQWPDMPQTYISYRVALSQPINVLSSGVGVYVIQDNQGNGVLKNFRMGGQYMYQLRFSKKLAMNFGVDASLVQRQLSWNDLQFYDQINFLTGFSDASGLPNPTNEPVPASLNKNFFDMGLGTALVSTNWYLGLSAAHILQPNLSFYNDSESKLPMAVTGQAGVILFNKKRANPLYVNPLMVITSQGRSNQLLIGSYFNKGAFYPGIFLKHNFNSFSDVCFNVGLKKGLLSFAYSYDLSLGSLSGNSGGSHELSFIVNWKTRSTKQSNKNRDILKCPRFFYVIIN
ncbi:MAG: PorP/SprF family type IX secretion system membrane protein [Bacteroidetes bacterium]|nr:PorP/SprF family type IX secretion system membrane protein [Bacteroidota bacterium]